MRVKLRAEARPQRHKRFTIKTGAINNESLHSFYWQFILFSILIYFFFFFCFNLVSNSRKACKANYLYLTSFFCLWNVQMCHCANMHHRLGLESLLSPSECWRSESFSCDARVELWHLLLIFDKLASILEEFLLVLFLLQMVKQMQMAIWR